jgi:FkbM family methyltransferase
LGGYDGQWASDIYGRYGCTVYFFEPVQLYAEKITSRFAKNPKIKVFPFALGGKDHKLVIAISGTSSSVFSDGKLTQEIQIVDASKWFEDSGLTSVALMKVNIEGGEFELMDRLIAAEKLSLIQDIQIQFHDVSPDSRERMERIQQFLERTHKRTYAYEFIWENWSKQ